ncbi:MAG TPA: TIGR02530 family flagellar biosynthesis protein [Geobacteraceae bacterium]|nr:TIGR02530 family flagellar biosynthesis protein [Geobacteraceae bacterium]
MIDQIYFPNHVQAPGSRTQPKPETAGAGKVQTSFEQVLANKLPSQGIKFSQHARERLQTRGITLSDNDLKKLQNAVDSVANKGGRESLVMMGNNAFVVSTKNRTVITAMDRDSMQGNVFTNIDSAVLL